MEHFSKSAIWGRHHQLDDSLVGQLTSADRTSVEDILKRVKVQKEVVRCKKIAYKLQCPSFSYSTMHYAVVILLLQSPAFLWLSEFSDCRSHICGRYFEESESAKRSCVMQNSLKKMAVSCYQLQYYAVAGFLLQSVRSFGFVSFQTAERTTVEKI